jgi:hypothetical protein
VILPKLPTVWFGLIWDSVGDQLSYSTNRARAGLLWSYVFLTLLEGRRDRRRRDTTGLVGNSLNAIITCKYQRVFALERPLPLLSKLLIERFLKSVLLAAATPISSFERES